LIGVVALYPDQTSGTLKKNRDQTEHERVVDSVRRLDAMVCVGKEHKTLDLTGRGFAAEADDPARVQDVVTSPTPGAL
jgi:hypothetical protein